MYISLAVLLLVAPGVAPRVAPADDTPRAEKKICRAQEETGSIFVRRVCHTRAEWIDIDAARQRYIERFRRPDNNGRPNGG